MKTIYAVTLSLFAVCLSAADLPKYWAVHIDSVADRATYERLGKQEEEIRRDLYKAHDVPPLKSWKLETNDGTYFSFRGRESLADFEKPSTVPEDVRKELNQKFAPLEPKIHASLKNHHSEIWQVDNDLTFLPSPAAPKYARLITEQVKPSQWDAYNDVMKRVRAALEKNGVALIVFSADYGDGACRYVLLSDKPIDIKTIAGDDLLRAWRTAVISSSNVEAHARPDLTAGDASKWIQ